MPKLFPNGSYKDSFFNLPIIILTQVFFVNDQEVIRAVVDYRGNVQGVGFRMTAVGQVQDAPLVGWVMNESDGSVRLEVEGSRREVDAFLKRVRRTLQERIEDEHVEYRDPLKKETSFSIRY